VHEQDEQQVSADDAPDEEDEEQEIAAQRPQNTRAIELDCLRDR
jgi:hypothetical protein